MALSAAQMVVMSRLLDEALPLDADGRRRWLDRLGAEHRDLAPALREALLPDSRAAASTELATLPKIVRGDDRAAAAVIHALKGGERVGPYQLLRELGAGGMAEVWLARRADGAYKRVVALKLPMLATLHRDLARRFARERDILASLEHPNIARLYDAGVSTVGLPYLAMEYVEGQPLTTWCDARAVGLRERLEIFLQVIDAVQYAHARQVIHRDLKPSNILVGAGDQVRLLDFGVAKLLAEEEGERVAPVQSYARALTPDYASPELLRGDPVDAASDVYSLGAVLYELLCGNRPYHLRRGVNAAELERAIAAARIEKPSDRVAPGAGAARATTQERLAGRLRGDLDAIALKALAMSPTSRYPGAAALADDLHRYLRNEPVAALPPRRSAEELIAHLSRNPKVRVRSLAVDSPRAEDAPSPEGRRAPASARRLRIATQLLRAVDGVPLWTRHFDVTLGDRSGDDAAIASTVAEALAAARAAGDGNDDVVAPASRAQALLLKAGFLCRRGTRADVEHAVALLERAVALEPRHALAWSTLALARASQAVRRWIPMRDANERAREAVATALAIDDDLAAAHVALGVLHETFYWNWTKAKAEYRRACALDPHDDEGAIRLALLAEAAVGRFEPALGVLERALARDPLAGGVLRALAWVQAASGRWPQAVATCDESLTLYPDGHGVRALLALCLSATGRVEEAVAAAQAEADPSSRAAMLPIVLSTAGRAAEAATATRELEDQFGGGSPYPVACVHAQAGRLDAAFKWLDRAWRQHDPALPLAGVDPLLEPLRHDARFGPLCARMKLAG